MGRRLQQASNKATIVTKITLYLSPAGGTFKVGSTVTVVIRENSLTTAVNTVQANVSYPTATLQFSAVNNTGSPFTTTIQSTGGSGLVQLGVGILGGSTTGDQLVGTITFTALAAGPAALTFSSGSGIASASTSTDVCQQENGATYTITN